jgi:hypothetical protein
VREASSHTRGGETDHDPFLAVIQLPPKRRSSVFLQCFFLDPTAIAHEQFFLLSEEVAVAADV